MKKGDIFYTANMFGGIEQVSITKINEDSISAEIHWDETYGNSSIYKTKLFSTREAAEENRTITQESDAKEIYERLNTPKELLDRMFSIYANECILCTQERNAVKKRIKEFFDIEL
jgi:hypothetical protein